MSGNIRNQIAAMAAMVPKEVTRNRGAKRPMSFRFRLGIPDVGSVTIGPGGVGGILPLQGRKFWDAAKSISFDAQSMGEWNILAPGRRPS